MNEIEEVAFYLLSLFSFLLFFIFLIFYLFIFFYPTLSAIDPCATDVIPEIPFKPASRNHKSVTPGARALNY